MKALLEFLNTLYKFLKSVKLAVVLIGYITVTSILAMLGEILGVKVQAEYVPPRPGEVRHSRASIEAAGRILGYKPLVGIREGLEETADWLCGGRGGGGGGSD